MTIFEENQILVFKDEGLHQYKLVYGNKTSYLDKQVYEQYLKQPELAMDLIKELKSDDMPDQGLLFS